MKTKTTPTLLLASLAATTALAAAAPTPASPPAKPNIIYIMLDDMPYDMLPHSARYPFLNLPNLERLQREGVTFTNFFCINSLCAPSRATNLTGTYSHTNGQTQNIGFLDPDWKKTPPFSVYMRDAGYTTAFIGKIHMASDPTHRGKNAIRPGFDYWVSIYGQGVYNDPLLVDNGAEKQTKGYITDIFNRYALDWIENKRDKSKPFVLCLWEKAVHEPFEPAARHTNLYKSETITPPFLRTDQDDLATKPKYQRVKVVDNKVVFPDRIPPKPWNPRAGQWGQLRALSAVDDSLGDILALLEKQGILDNTIIMFSSDNGYFHQEHQRGDKRLAYENSIRIPMVVRYPAALTALKPGSTIDSMCLNLDVAPTILDIAGVTATAIAPQMQGASLKPQLEGRPAAPDWRKTFLYEYYYDNGLRASRIPDLVGIRGERYKFVDNDYLNSTDIGELYDMQTDPGEMKNLFQDPASALLLAEQRKELDALKAQYGYNPDRNWWVMKLNPNFKDTRDDLGLKPDKPAAKKGQGATTPKAGKAGKSGKKKPAPTQEQEDQE